MIAQGCHVVTKVLWELKEEENVIKYVADMDNMHKVRVVAFGIMPQFKNLFRRAKLYQLRSLST